MCMRRVHPLTCMACAWHACTGFYEEAARRVGADRPGDSFTARFDGLRRLCCHPATSEVWARRLEQVRSPAVSRPLLPSLTFSDLL